MFYAVENSSICNFADDTTPYLCGYKVNEVKRDVEDNCATLVAWFKDNFLPLNADKWHLLFSGCNMEHMFAPVGDAIIWEENSVNNIGNFYRFEIII